MDGMGFAFEGIDWFGRSRDQEFGKPIDDTSTFPLDGQDVTVDGPAGVAAVMADSKEVATCIAGQWVSYAAGIPDQDASACLVQRISERMQESGGLRGMVIETVMSDWYRRGPGATK
jgi:hypothetical protein